MVCFYLKISKNFVLNFPEQILVCAFVYMVKVSSIAQFLVNHFPYFILPALVFFLCKFVAFIIMVDVFISLLQLTFTWWLIYISICLKSFYTIYWSICFNAQLYKSLNFTWHDPCRCQHAKTLYSLFFFFFLSLSLFQRFANMNSSSTVTEDELE